MSKEAAILHEFTLEYITPLHMYIYTNSAQSISYNKKFL